MEKHQDAVETTFTRSHLWKPILGDVAAAAISATLITPVITVIDQCVLLIKISQMPTLTHI
jgi:hypothetical protein